MNTISLNSSTKTISNTNKFQSLSLIENGLILKFQNKLSIEIPYAEVDKVYIKKYKLNPIVEFLCIALPFLFVCVALQYLPFHLMIFLSLISLIPIFLRVLNYKWYQLFVILKDGTFFRKRVSLNTKMENFAILNKVEKEIFDYKSNTLASV